MKTRVTRIIQEVLNIYQWIDEELIQIDQSCKGCGDCCDFEVFGHRLYVTTPELIFFWHYLDSQIKTMDRGICPYRIDARCSVYPYRFSGCRIFSCKGDSEQENTLCEQAISKFKVLCDKHQLPYHYVDLKTGLEMLGRNPEFIKQH